MTSELLSIPLFERVQQSAAADGKAVYVRWHRYRFCLQERRIAHEISHAEATHERRGHADL
ncbi:MAG: hypothetical protein SNJ69_04150 [Chloroflexaceae bacterium]